MDAPTAPTLCDDCLRFTCRCEPLTAVPVQERRETEPHVWNPWSAGIAANA
jgi:hypothetical protein